MNARDRERELAEIRWRYERRRHTINERAR